MRTALFATLFMGVFASSVPAEDAVAPARVDAAFIGDWTGQVTEQNVDTTYPITLKIFESKGRVFQNVHYGGPYDCRGGGAVIDAGTGTLHMSELIVSGRDTCADGSMRLTQTGKDAVLWEWSYTDGTTTARADLTRQ